MVLSICVSLWKSQGAQGYCSSDFVARSHLWLPWAGAVSCSSGYQRSAESLTILSHGFFSPWDRGFFPLWATRDLCNGTRKWSWDSVLAEKFMVVMAMNNLLILAYCHWCLWNSLIHALHACPTLKSSSNWKYLFKTPAFTSQTSGSSLGS